MTLLDFLFHVLDEKAKEFGLAWKWKGKIKPTTVCSTVDQKHVINSQPITIHINKTHL